MINTIAYVAQIFWVPATRLHEEGIPYHAYLTELTWLLFLKIAPMIGASSVPAHLSWESLVKKPDKEQYEYYQEVIRELEHNTDPLIAGIYTHARTSFKKPEQLAQLITTLAVVDTVPIDNLGEIYETLLEKCICEDLNRLHIAPRSLVDLVVILTQPQLGELIQDPLAGTATFVVAAEQYIKVINDELLNSNSSDKSRFIAIEPSLVLQRLALMNCVLHDFEYPQHLPVRWGDSLLSNLEIWPPADLILSMIIFTGEHVEDFDKHDTSLSLLEHICQILKPGGRAAVVLSDKVLKAAGRAQQVRSSLLDTCVVHTVLRLPYGVFFPHNVSANVLFFRKSKTADEKTKTVWFYDLRTNCPIFGQYLHLTREHLMEFEKVYGDDPLGQAPRETESERWRCFSRETLAKQGDSLEMSWLEDQGAATDNNMITGEVWELLDETVTDLESLTDILHDDIEKK